MVKNTVRIGTISELKVKTRVMELGITEILNPISNDLPYDFILDLGKFYKIQVKTGRIKNGAVLFYTTSHVCNMNKRVRKNYIGKIDYFAVYCPDNDGYYLISINESSKSTMKLRVSPTKNNNKKNIKWAKDYLLDTRIKEIIEPVG